MVEEENSATMYELVDFVGTNRMIIRAFRIGTDDWHRVGLSYACFLLLSFPKYKHILRRLFPLL